MFVQINGHTFINADTFFTYSKEDMIDKLKKILKEFRIEIHESSTPSNLEKYLENLEGYFYFRQDYYAQQKHIGVLEDNEEMQYSYQVTQLCDEIIDRIKTIDKLEEGKCVFSWVEYTHKFKGGSDYRIIEAKIGNLHHVASWLMDEGVMNVLGQDQTVYCNGEVVPSSVVKQLLHYYIDRYE